MKKSNASFVVGTLLVLFGIWIVGNVTGLFHFRISWLFFKGWWTLFLIIPGFIGLFNERTRTSGAKKLSVGVLLFLLFQRTLPFKTLLMLAIACALLIYGLKLLFRNQNGTNQNGVNQNRTRDAGDKKMENDRYFGKGYSGKSDEKISDKSGSNSSRDQTIVFSSILSSKVIHVDNERFVGANVSTVLGSIDLDLRNSFVIDDVLIQASCVLGDIKICVPEDVRVVVMGSPVLGDITEKRRNPAWADENTPVITIKASCVLGSIVVK